MKDENKEFIKKLIPFSLCALVIILDQVTKIMVANTIPMNTIRWSFFDGFVRIIHARNLGAAFSMGAGWSFTMRKIVFSLLPILVIAYVIRIYFKSTELTGLQRWCICGVIGGGIGNLIDRIFRPFGVVDFIDVQWFGWENAPLKVLRMERWPTFNVADAMVVVFGIILICSFIVMIKKAEDAEKSKKKGKK